MRFTDVLRNNYYYNFFIFQIRQSSFGGSHTVSPAYLQLPDLSQPVAVAVPVWSMLRLDNGNGASHRNLYWSTQSGHTVDIRIHCHAYLDCICHRQSTSFRYYYNGEYNWRYFFCMPTPTNIFRFIFLIYCKHRLNTSRMYNRKFVALVTNKLLWFFF